MSDLISFVPAPATTGNAALTSATSLADNFDTFLTILTAQIQNQDPLEPLDSSQFTEQLVQFSGVEQQIRANQSLDALLAQTRANTGAALASYLGQEAEIDSAGGQFRGEPVHWRYSLPSGADSATVTVTDKTGKIVWSGPAETGIGSHDFTWDGSLTAGGTAGDDVYYINVVAKDADGATVEPAYSLVTTITGVDLTYGEPAVTTSAGIFSFADVKRLTKLSQSPI